METKFYTVNSPAPSIQNNSRRQNRYVKMPKDYSPKHLMTKTKEERLEKRANIITNLFFVGYGIMSITLIILSILFPKVATASFPVEDPVPTTSITSEVESNKVIIPPVIIDQPIFPDVIATPSVEDFITEEPIEEPELPFRPEVDDIRVYEGPEQLDIYDELEVLGTYNITGYDPYCEHCCGKSDGITASGKPAQYHHTIAMNGIPFGTKIYVPGYGVYYVEDRGGSLVGVDIACESHEVCYQMTKKNVTVYIVHDKEGPSDGT